jgi:hypothetical protein
MYLSVASEESSLVHIEREWAESGNHTCSLEFPPTFPATTPDFE